MAGFATATGARSSSFSSSLSLLVGPSQTSFSASSSLRFSPIIKTPIISISPSKTLLTYHRTKASSSSSSSSNDNDTTFFENINPEEEIPWEPIAPPDGYVPPPYFDEGTPETEEEIASAYEEIYGPAYSGISVLGNNVNVMDSKVKKATGFGSKRKKERIRDGFDERVVQVRRVTKVVKGGKQMSFRAVVVVGDKQGQVGVGVGKAKEIISAVEKSATNARRNIISVPMTKYSTFPHRY